LNKAKIDDLTKEIADISKTTKKHDENIEKVKSQISAIGAGSQNLTWKTPVDPPKGSKSFKMMELAIAFIVFLVLGYMLGGR